MPTFLFHMRAEEIIAKVSTQVASEVAAMGYDLIEVSFAQGLLRLTIDTPQGVSLDDCVAVTRRVGLLLDAEDYIPGRYRLEVSSPGLTRRLTSRQEFEHFIGRAIKVIRKQGETRGVLKEVDAEGILVETDGATETVPFGDIVRANLDFEF